MSGFPYHVVDVFTERPFGGNPLAVFPDARGIPEALYAAIAQELNLSETTFVLPPTTADCHCKVRIFTPGRELPTAGHPTVGTAFVLTRLGLFDPAAHGGSMRMEQGVGTVPVTIEMAGDAPGRITMQQNVPRFGPEEPRRAEIAAMLSLEESDLLEGVPIEVGSAGVPFLYVPLRTLDAARRAVVRMDLWSRLLAGREADSPFVLTLETENPDATVHGRMFAPGMGITEDPATGIASGPLGGYLARHGLVPHSPVVSIVSEQGLEMGRPSRIEIGLTMDGNTGANNTSANHTGANHTSNTGASNTVTGVTVGGHSVYMASCSMHLP